MWPAVRRGLDWVVVDAAAVRRHRLVAGVGRRPARPGQPRRPCWPARRASTSRCGPGARSPSCWTSRSPSGSSPAAGSATRCASTATCSSTSPSSRWTGTTRCSAAPSAAQAGHDLLDSRWDEFVVPGLGIRCVVTNPWVTGAETCELVMALDALGDRDRALRLFADMQHLRHESGGYWTGYVYPDDVFWPRRAHHLHAAAVILAADALGRRTSRRRASCAGRRWCRTSRRSALECGCPELSDRTGETSAGVLPPCLRSGQHPHRAQRVRPGSKRRWQPRAATRGTAPGRRPRVARTRRGSTSAPACGPASGRSRSSRSARAPRRGRRR